MPGGELNVDQAVQEFQALRAARSFQLQACQLDVEALLRRREANVRCGARLLGQVGQALGQLQRDRLAIVQSEHPHQLLARRGRGLLRRRQLRRRVRMENMLPCALEFAEVAHLLHPLGQLRAGLCRPVHLAGVNQQLLRGDRPHPGLADLADLVHHRRSELDARL